MFPVNMQVTIHNQAQLTALLAAMDPESASAPVADPPAEKPAAKKSSSKPAKAAKPAPTQTAKDEKPAKTESAPESPSDEAPTREQAAAAVVALSRAKGRDAAVAELAEFGAENLDGVAVEQYAELIQACNKAAK